MSAAGLHPAAVPGPGGRAPAAEPASSPGLGPTPDRRARPAALRPLVRLVAGGLLGRRRTLAVLALAAAPVLLAALIAIGGGLGDSAHTAYATFTRLTLGLVVPLVALVLGTGALGTQIDDGTIVYVLVKPVPRRTVVAAATAVAATASATIAGVSALASGLLGVGTTAPDILFGSVVAAVVAAVVYATVFVALSIHTGRALVTGLAYVLLWEGLVTVLFTGTRILSIREYALSILVAVSDTAARAHTAGVALPVALVLAAVMLVLAVALGARRLERFELTDTD